MQAGVVSWAKKGAVILGSCRLMTGDCISLLLWNGECLNRAKDHFKTATLIAAFKRQALWGKGSLVWFSLFHLKEHLLTELRVK